jgi:hypothetical protein
MSCGKGILYVTNSVPSFAEFFDEPDRWSVIQVAWNLEFPRGKP